MKCYNINSTKYYEVEYSVTPNQPTPICTPVLNCINIEIDELCGFQMKVALTQTLRYLSMSKQNNKLGKKKRNQNQAFVVKYVHTYQEFVLGNFLRIPLFLIKKSFFFSCVFMFIVYHMHVQFMYFLFTLFKNRLFSL